MGSLFCGLKVILNGCMYSHKLYVSLVQEKKQLPSLQQLCSRVLLKKDVENLLKIKKMTTVIASKDILDFYEEVKPETKKIIRITETQLIIRP